MFETLYYKQFFNVTFLHKCLSELVSHFSFNISLFHGEI